MHRRRLQLHLDPARLPPASVPGASVPSWAIADAVLPPKTARISHLCHMARSSIGLLLCLRRETPLTSDADLGVLPARPNGGGSHALRGAAQLAHLEATR